MMLKITFALTIGLVIISCKKKEAANIPPCLNAQNYTITRPDSLRLINCSEVVLHFDEYKTGQQLVVYPRDTGYLKFSEAGKYDLIYSNARQLTQATPYILKITVK